MALGGNRSGRLSVRVRLRDPRPQRAPGTTRARRRRARRWARRRGGGSHSGPWCLRAAFREHLGAQEAMPTASTEPALDREARSPARRGTRTHGCDRGALSGWQDDRRKCPRHRVLKALHALNSDRSRSRAGRKSTIEPSSKWARSASTAAACRASRSLNAAASRTKSSKNS